MMQMLNNSLYDKHSVKTCISIYVYIVSNILSQVIFFFFLRGGNFNVLLMKLKQKKNKYKSP